MIKLNNKILMMVAVLSVAVMALVSFAQDRNLAYDDWYGDMKKTLTDHYTGKTVKLRMAIPDTRRGLEIQDGEFNSSEDDNSMNALARPGDEVTIKSFKIRDQNIELQLLKLGEKRKRRFFSFARNPRINLRLSRELTSKDLTIENINQWLSAAVDVTPLGGTAAGLNTATAQASIVPEPEPAKTDGNRDNPRGLPTPSVSGNLNSSEDGIGELTIECPVRARVYIDDAYSGFAPRTIRLKSGIHSILVMADGHAWEQRLFIPAGKASTVKAEIQR